MLDCVDTAFVCVCVCVFEFVSGTEKFEEVEFIEEI